MLLRPVFSKEIADSLSAILHLRSSVPVLVAAFAARLPRRLYL
jgi:hypothetical protein